VVGSLATPAGYDRPVGLAVLLLDLPTRFLPPGYIGEIEPGFLPRHTYHGRALRVDRDRSSGPSPPWPACSRSR
jgi:hypothetical protein